MAKAPDQQGDPPWFRSPHLWVSSSYFAEGFPYTVVNSMAEILFKELGASLQVVGLTSLFHLPWNFKFIWGPFVDGYESKRRWLLLCEVVITVVLVGLGLLAALGAQTLLPLAAGFLVLALLSATHDIAVDGYYLEALDDDGQSRFVGYRAAAYRVAMLAVSGPLLWICARVGWTAGLLLTAVLMGGLTAYHVVGLPQVEGRRHPWRALLAPLTSWRVLPFVGAALLLYAVESWWALGASLSMKLSEIGEAAPWLAGIGIGAWAAIALLLALLMVLAWLPRLRRRLDAARERGELSEYAASFVSFLDQPKIGVVLAFVILFRTGESFLQKMRWPFFDDVVSLPLEVYGVTNGTIGVFASFTATIIGGRLIARDGLRRWIWPFMLAQNVLNLMYMVVALLPDPTILSGAGEGWLAYAPLTLIIALEHAGAGLGTAVFMVYLMRTCDPAHKAGHMAIVTALMSLSFTLAGVLSGFLAEAMGFAAYFGFTFLATIPGMALIPFVPYLDGRAKAPAS
ncbi:MAG: hypothetical protein KC431_06525 [Myxococcales bacterium]|nr:hypothetical protein [Myxococcales bacterium]